VALLLVSVAWELVLFGRPALWERRRYAVGPSVVLVSFGTAGLVFEHAEVLVGLVVLTGLFRVLNMLRVAQGRMHEQYLRHTARRTGLIVAAAQVAAVGLLLAVDVENTAWLTLLTVVQVLGAGGVLLVTLRNLIKTKHQPVLEHYADKELPTVTVAIPARNETADLEECLRSILANNYPKLEVLVLDDCSQDKTSDIIKAFAQDGVRFIKGQEPLERWLAKNQAYDRLADEANGELLLFCGVDVRLGPDAIRALVSTLLSRKKDMISVLPRRLVSDPLSTLIQPMRYWWELALPRRTFNRPAVLSTCWLIRRKSLQKLGGFEAVNHAIIPEGYFARELVKSDGYSFIRADNVLDVQTRKNVRDQLETAIRTRYPQIRRRPEMALLLTLIQTLFLIGPFAVAATAFWLGLQAPQTLALAACVLLVLTHVSIVQASDPPNVLTALFTFPLACLAEVVLGYTSMFKYEFSTVDWKGRNVCIPVMHVVPKLPNMPSARK